MVTTKGGNTGSMKQAPYLDLALAAQRIFEKPRRRVKTKQHVFSDSELFAINSSVTVKVPISLINDLADL
jgi:hypothetical protein